MALKTIVGLTVLASARADCSAFTNRLQLVVQGHCYGIKSCDDFGPVCRGAATGLLATYASEAEGCLEAAAAGLDVAVVEAVLTCPETLAAEEQALAEANGDAVPDPSDAVEFRGDCSEFKVMAEKVYETCSAATCCADVVADETCRADAAGLHANFPGPAMAFCAAMVQLDRSCSCFTRQVAACALQDEVHRILYSEAWAPSCNPFPAMAYQQDNNQEPAVAAADGTPRQGGTAVAEDANDDGTDESVLGALLGVACGIILAVSLVACRLRRSVKILAEEVATAKPKNAAVKMVDPAKATVVDAPGGGGTAGLPEAKPEAPAEAVAEEDLEANLA